MRKTLMSLGKRLGLGALLYRCYHAPLGWLNRCRRKGLRQLLREYCGHLQMSVRGRTRYKQEFLLYPGHYIDGIVFREGYYESEVLEAIRPYLGEGSVFWDIGANFGLHAITAKALHPAATVVALEPSPVLASRILANSSLNGVEIQVVSVGLWNQSGFKLLHCVNECNPGMTTFFPGSGTNGCCCLSVPVETGDALVRMGVVPPPTVMKIDVEGAEAEVLQGMENVLSSPLLRAVVLEAQSDSLDDGKDLPPEMQLLAASGLTAIEPLQRREHTAHNLSNFIAKRHNRIA
jgi:FkbM family methyltransferase